jgi:hypothetical protein
LRSRDKISSLSGHEVPPALENRPQPYSGPKHDYDSQSGQDRKPTPLNSPDMLGKSAFRDKAFAFGEPFAFLICKGCRSLFACRQKCREQRRDLGCVVLAPREPCLGVGQIVTKAEDWEARLGALILGADTVVFILSPAAVRSPRCTWEVERAAELGKRLIPVQGAPVPEVDVPERLRRLNYIFFREGQSFARPLRELADALRQDVEWIREHTRLSEAATRWQARDRSRGTGAADDLLLRVFEKDR